MIERLTDRARRIMDRAYQEARERNHDAIELGHVLLAILSEGGGMATSLLNTHGIDDLQLISLLDGIDGGDGTAPKLSDATRRGLSQAIKEADQLGHKFVGPEPLLLGLLRTEGVDSRLLSRLGLSSESLAAGLEAMLKKGGAAGGQDRGGTRRTIGLRMNPATRKQGERLSISARKTMALARQEALRQERTRVSSGHILVAMMLEEDCKASELLRGAGIVLDQLRSQVDGITQDKQETDDAGTSPVTMQAREILDLATQEADDLGNDEITTEHLLLGILKHSSCTATQVLGHLGIDLHYLRAQVDSCVD